jgi:DNA-binding transcriptional regulator YiaG
MKSLTQRSTRRSAVAEPAPRRELNARFIRDVIQAEGLSYAEAARLLRTSIHTLRGWMKPSSAGAAPDMAVELLCLKTGFALPPWIGDEKT